MIRWISAENDRPSPRPATHKNSAASANSASAFDERVGITPVCDGAAQIPRRPELPDFASINLSHSVFDFHSPSLVGPEVHCTVERFDQRECELGPLMLAKLCGLLLEFGKHGRHGQPRVTTRINGRQAYLAASAA
jgi:hypothetical protein